jgi:hypothetical protein
LEQLAAQPQALPADAGPTLTSAPLIRVETPRSERTSLRREVILVSSNKKSRTTHPKTKERCTQTRKSRWKLLKMSKCSKRRIEQVVVIPMKEEFSVLSLNSYFCTLAPPI